MLTHLYINDVVLIHSLSLDLRSGFSVFTGETGAGKSILLDAISLSLGKRGDLSLIRKGAEQAVVVSTFEAGDLHQDFLMENGLIDSDSPQTIRLKRILDPKKSKAFINDVPVSISLLKEIGDKLLDIHSQFDSLFETSLHQKILDRYSQNNVFHKNLSELELVYATLREKEKALDVLMRSHTEQMHKRVLYESIKQDLSFLNIEENEEESLLAERAQINDMAKASPLIERVFALSNNPSLQKELRFLLLASIPEVLKLSLEALESTLLEVQAQAQELVESTKDTSFRLNQIDDRLHTLRLYAKKYAVTTDNLISLLNEAQAFFNQDFDADKLLLEKQIEEIKMQYSDLAQQISVVRHQEALHLEKKIDTEFAFLKLPEARFKVSITPLGYFSLHGFDCIEFQIAANKGQDFSPLAKSASGGELSRIMLALKTVMSHNTLSIVFDEIDSGVGGATASAIGDRLKMLSKKTQVLSITHSPQVASKADCHYLVKKIKVEEKTKTQVLELTSEERLEEVARMLSGENITQASLQAAKELF